LKLQPELIVEHPEIAVATAHDRFRHYSADFLRHYADIGFLFAVIDKSIEAEAIVETPKQCDVVLEPNIGAPAAAARHGPRTTGTAANMARARRAGVSHRCRPGRAGLSRGRRSGRARLLPRCLRARCADLSTSCLLPLLGGLPVSRTLTRPRSFLGSGGLSVLCRRARLFPGAGPVGNCALAGGTDRRAGGGSA